MPQNRFCPVCCAYMLHMTTNMAMTKWKKCPTCGWCEDENGENVVTKQLDSSHITAEERRVLIKNWRKLKLE